MSLTPRGGVPAEGELCFYCGELVHDPAVVWRGRTDCEQCLGNICLHPVCAVEFCLRILRDVHEWECTTHSELLARQVGGGPR
jgi:hypothetical protein